MNEGKETVIEEKIANKRHRVMSGHGPHKLFRVAIKKYLDKKKDENKDKDIFDIDRIQWKEIDESE